MSKNTDFFTPTTMNGNSGFIASLCLTLQAEEARLAQIAGSGTSVPDAFGNIPAGTIKRGHIVFAGVNGTAELFTSPDLNAVLSQLPYVVLSGNDDLSGARTGTLTLGHGGIRMNNPIYNAAHTYVPNTPLIAVAGVLENKVFGDNKQIVAYVGPRGLYTSERGASVLDVVFPQGVGGRY